MSNYCHPKPLQVRLHDGREFPGRVLAVDPSSDLATVKIDAVLLPSAWANCSRHHSGRLQQDLPCLKLANSREAQPGEFVVALGSPLCLTNTVTTGSLSHPLISLQSSVWPTCPGVISSTSRRLAELIPGSGRGGGGGLVLEQEGVRIDVERMEYIQTDAPINVGNSGGPLVNLVSFFFSLLDSLP